MPRKEDAKSVDSDDKLVALRSYKGPMGYVLLVVRSGQAKATNA